MDTRTLLVLMWKHGVVRCRRFIHTTLDLVCPLLFFILLFALKNELMPELPKHLKEVVKQPIADTDAIPISRKVAPTLVAYYPRTPLSTALMDMAAKQLKLHPVDENATELNSVYFGSQDLNRLKKFAANTMPILGAVVIFQNMVGDTWPRKLNYTIRMKNDYHLDTRGYLSGDSQPGPHRMYGLNYDPFLCLQWAIDSSYMKLIAPGNDIKQTVYLREFPYYNSPKNSVASEVCHALVILSWFSLMLPFVFLMCRLLEERTSGIQELMKMVGVSLNTLGLSHYLNVALPGLVFAIGGTWLLKAEPNPLVPNSNGFLIFLMLLLYYNSVVSMAFACSYISRSTTYAATLSVLSYVVLTIPFRAAAMLQPMLPKALPIATGVFPHKPMAWFWYNVAELELHGVGLNFSNLFSTIHPNDGSVMLSYVFMILQTVFFYLLSWYLSLTRPGKYGQALPWGFVCTKQYWLRNEVQPNFAADEEVPITHDGVYFEQPPRNAHVGIKIDNVSKKYLSQKALKNVSLEVLKGEITVLVGHNGAGKTTLMSIITGMTSASSGRVLVHGKDTLAQRGEVRKHLGFCPQHNLFFPDLTVQQHIMFFTMFKHGSYSEAKASSMKLAMKLGLEDKLYVLPGELSGGMKRRAQLACALAGDADVLILDEPTSGLDVENRRHLWDLLLSLRGSRTVLLTTHFMEEADALGDRVAALHRGALRCFATTMYLKKAIGTGYRVSFTTIGVPNETAITAAIHAHVPDASVRDKSIGSIAYNLPASSSAQFPKLFAALEDNRSALAIDSIGVGVTTLEEVFLKLCSDVDFSLVEDEIDAAPASVPSTKRVTGMRLYSRQLWVLLKRQFEYAMYRKWHFIILQLALPLAFIFIVAMHSNNEHSIVAQHVTALTLDMYADRTSRVLYRASESDVLHLREQYTHVTFEKTDDVAQAVLGKGMDDILDYNKYVVGVEVDDKSATALYTTTIRHAAPISLNLLSNLLLTRILPWADGKTIVTYSHPIDNKNQQFVATRPKELEMAFQWGIFITFLMLSTNINAISLPCKERLTGSRHIHLMSGCPAALHWFATLLWHVLVCTATLIVPAVLCVGVFDTDATVDNPTVLAALFMILFLGSLAFFPFMYLVSFNFNERGASTVLITILIVFGILTPSLGYADMLFEVNASATSLWGVVLRVCTCVLPSHALVSAALRALHVARLNAWCEQLRDNCPNFVYNEAGFDTQKCCDFGGRCYFCFDGFSPVSGMCVLFFQFLVYMTLVVLVELGVVSGLCSRLLNVRYQPRPDPGAHANVRAEREYVRKNIQLPTKQIPDAMLLDDLHKNYVPLMPWKSSCNAVKGISFSVKKGECFGLLGVNGAGKTTTFKMLTAEETPTRGRIFGNGHHLRTGNSSYLQSLGYCPQFFGLDMFLSGRANLTMLLTLRGLDADWVEAEVETWLDTVELQQHAGRPVETYSGGCARRLGTCAALCGGAAVALLDEPSAGVDAAARRRLWAALRSTARHARALLVTSHSMDEMEALCQRIAIMSGGRVRALGSPAALRADYGAGFALVFKLRPLTADDEVDSTKTTDALKTQIHEKFNCTLKDEHKTMLHFHINETLRYSELFLTLEALRQSIPEIEDYTVSDTTLEEVFLSFAREQNPQV